MVYAISNVYKECSSLLYRYRLDKAEKCLPELSREYTIHGGLTKGSAGCIDIPWQTGKLSNYLDDCQDSVPVYVKYPKDW